ncbi:hypothetical protein L3049_05885 [Labilibaculum sp. DW002]|uniref:CBM-cenC domain-containing protein n=1 Tax=Paralabilibaculum antarcticum TaxID=2912572 RepID=A0ABT5VQ30_9BACT|nr:hypothetical protein [Labilibaculum sp. DW002]MDE5417534.1 hypothetical protein [Labilibaculum sp. DW002]
MKNINLIFGLFMLLLVVGCDDEYEPLNDYSDVNWYTDMSHARPNSIGLDKYMSFADLSQNALTHEWQLDPNFDDKFLTGRIIRQDSNYVDFIDENAGSVSYDNTVHVLFTSPGLHNLRLYNTFKEYVEFIGNDTLAAVKQGDVWVIDTTFVLDVYDTLQPALKLFLDGNEVLDLPANSAVNELDSASWPTLEIEAGKAINFVDMTTIDRPTGRTWIIPGGTGGKSDSTELNYFYRLGTFKPVMVSSRNSKNVPYGYKRQPIPLKIKVIKSTLPFEVAGNAMELEDETIQFSLTGEIVPFFNQEEFFTVHVTNPNTGFDEEIEVQAAKVNSELGNVIDLTLSQPIYSYDDVVTISYSGGEIISLDERNLVDIVDAPVVMYNPNVLSDPAYGFEDAGAGWVPMWDNTATIEYTTEKAASGSYSMKMTQFGGKGKIESKNAPATMKVGKSYVYTYKVWVDASTTAGSMSTWFFPEWKQNWVGLNDKPKGEWVTIEKTFDYNLGGTLIIMFTLNGEGVIYVDDFSMIERDARP